jgi:hypothetical protein
MLLARTGKVEQSQEGQEKVSDLRAKMKRE